MSNYHIDMKEELKKKLKSYSIAAGAVLSAGTSNAGVVYTDVNPDQTFSTNGNSYLLDLNNDNTDDFEISVMKSNFTFTSFTFSTFRASVSPLNTNEVAASSSYYALALAANAQVGAALSWANTSSLLMAARFAFATFSSSSSSSYGQWVGATNKYLGLKLKVGSNTYYGWARLDVNTSAGSFTIKDYAYDNTNNTSILTGAMPTADLATNVMATDVDDNANGSDLQVDFIKATNEATVDEYRIMVVKNAASGSFDLTQAMAVGSANYTQVIPNGSNVSMALSSSAKDVDGDDIELGQPYKVFVLSKPDGVIRTLYGLSNSSNLVVLNTTAGVATSLVATDVADNGQGADFEVSFQRAPDEAKVGEYRVIVLRLADVATFDLAKAQALPAANYTVISPTGSAIQQVLPASAKDSKGFVLSESVAYKYFVMSLANGIKANLDSLSAASNEITLSKNIGIGELSEGNISVFSTGKVIQIDLATFSGNAKVDVYDANGKRVYESRLNSNKERIELNRPAGVYLINIKLNGEQFVKRVELH